MRCKNCGIEGTGDYCAQCGQKYHIHIDPTFHDLVHDTIHEFLHLDGKIFQTIFTLFRYPGKLTREFLDGRRLRYINPIRLYLTMSLLYFILSAVSYGLGDIVSKEFTEPPPDVNKMIEEQFAKVEDKEDSSEAQKEIHKETLKKIKEETKKAAKAIEDATKENGDSTNGVTMNLETGTFIDQKFKEWTPVFNKGIKRLNEDPSEYKRIYSASIAKALFLLMPIFALILSLLYWRHKRRYPQYLYFSIHYHAALFAGLIVVIGVDFFYDDAMMWWMFWAWLYLFLSLKRIWNDSTKRAIQRTCLTLVLYGSIYGLTLGLLGLYSIYKLGLKA